MVDEGERAEAVLVPWVLTTHMVCDLYLHVQTRKARHVAIREAKTTLFPATLVRLILAFE